MCGDGAVSTVRKIEDEVRYQPYMLIEFEDILEDAFGAAERIYEFAGLDL